MTSEELSKLQDVPIMEHKREELSDMDEIRLHLSESRNLRMQSFFEQVKNPFAQKVGAYILQIGCMEGAEDTLEERMLLFARRQAGTEL